MRSRSILFLILKTKKHLQKNTSVEVLFRFTYRYDDTYMVNTQTELVGFEPTCPGGLTHFECAPL